MRTFAEFSDCSFESLCWMEHFVSFRSVSSENYSAVQKTGRGTRSFQLDDKGHATQEVN